MYRAKAMGPPRYVEPGQRICSLPGCHSRTPQHLMVPVPATRIERWAGRLATNEHNNRMLVELFATPFKTFLLCPKHFPENEYTLYLQGDRSFELLPTMMRTTSSFLHKPYKVTKLMLEVAKQLDDDSDWQPPHANTRPPPKIRGDTNSHVQLAGPHIKKKVVIKDKCVRHVLERKRYLPRHERDMGIYKNNSNVNLLLNISPYSPPPVTDNVSSMEEVDVKMDPDEKPSELPSTLLSSTADDSRVKDEPPDAGPIEQFEEQLHREMCDAYNDIELLRIIAARYGVRISELMRENEELKNKLQQQATQDTSKVVKQEQEDNYSH